MSLILQTTPGNLRLAWEDRHLPLEGDVYRICERIREEVSPALFIVLHKDHPKPFAVFEHCDDGVDRIVKRYTVLDARIITDLQRMIAIPFEQRVKELERENEQFEMKWKEDELDRLYEIVGAPMRSQFAHDGFIEHTGVSYPKVGVAAPGRRK